MRDGILDTLGEEFQPTSGQRWLDHRFTAWGYELLREFLLPVFFMPSFSVELQNAIDRVDLKPGDTVVDLACGQGNFSVEFAKRVGPEGLVIGIDVSSAMLGRAVQRRARTGVENLLLIRGDALDLPLQTGALKGINCSGGLHQFPDLQRATAELGRVSLPGARIALSGFAHPPDRSPFLQQIFHRYEMDVISLSELATQLESVGFSNVGWEMGGPALGYIWAERRAA
jgi:ubiquinone/menaquinone biosynthesis C-methylase UbiE